jgi:trans-2,3-dihydro-3-hydroxyanthranilate isomerase
MAALFSAPFSGGRVACHRAGVVGAKMPPHACTENGQRCIPCMQRCRGEFAALRLERPQVPPRMRGAWLQPMASRCARMRVPRGHDLRFLDQATGFRAVSSATIADHRGRVSHAHNACRKRVVILAAEVFDGLTMTRRSLRFHLVNVFAEDSCWSGNALAVIEDARDLSDEDMQAIALQFNLSETTFVLPSTRGTARVRIFTPSFEMPFAGHPTLGTAHVVSKLGSVSDAVTLEMGAGVIPVKREGDTWTLCAKPPASRQANSSHAEIAEMLGLAERDVLGPVMWVDTGSEQLVVPLSSRSAVERCQPDPQLLARHGSNATRQGLAYVWARDADGQVTARFFFLKHGVVVEDPGTGSACANLGGWHLATKARLPIDLVVRQGEGTGRRCRLRLRVDAAERIFVSGRVVEIGRGELDAG